MNKYWLSSRNRNQILLATHSSTRQSAHLCCYNYFATVYFPSFNAGYVQYNTHPYCNIQGINIYNLSFTVQSCLAFEILLARIRRPAILSSSCSFPAPQGAEVNNSLIIRPKIISGPKTGTNLFSGCLFLIGQDGYVRKVHTTDVTRRCLKKIYHCIINK